MMAYFVESFWAAVKLKKATDTYKLYVEKYAAVKSAFKQKITETAQKFQDIEETHLLHMKEIIESLSNSIKEIHLQIEEVHEEFIDNMTNTTVKSLIKKFSESKGTGKERPGPIEFQECNTASAVEGIKPGKQKPFGLSGIMKTEKDTESISQKTAPRLYELFADIIIKGRKCCHEILRQDPVTIVIPVQQ